MHIVRLPLRLQLCLQSATAAGVADNVLPNTGLMNWNMRSHPDVPREEVLAYLENAAKAVGVNATLTVTPISHMVRHTQHQRCGLVCCSVVEQLISYKCFIRCMTAHTLVW